MTLGTHINNIAANAQAVSLDQFATTECEAGNQCSKKFNNGCADWHADGVYLSVVDSEDRFLGKVRVFLLSNFLFKAGLKKGDISLISEGDNLTLKVGETACVLKPPLKERKGPTRMCRLEVNPDTVCQRRVCTFAHDFLDILPRTERDISQALTPCHYSATCQNKEACYHFHSSIAIFQVCSEPDRFFRFQATTVSERIKSQDIIALGNRVLINGYVCRATYIPTEQKSELFAAIEQAPTATTCISVSAFERLEPVRAESRIDWTKDCATGPSCDGKGCRKKHPELARFKLPRDPEKPYQQRYFVLNLEELQAGLEFGCIWIIRTKGEQNEYMINGSRCSAVHLPVRANNITAGF
jgi:hypothetical protein